jgi:hypothetical protein
MATYMADRMAMAVTDMAVTDMVATERTTNNGT